MKKLQLILLVILLSSGCFGQIPTDGLVAWYPFNGNANDGSGYGNDGLVQGATLTTDRFNRPNQAYSFNGVDNYIIVAYNPVLDMPVSVSVSGWMCKVVNIPWASMVTKGGGGSNPQNNNYTVHNSNTGGIVFTSANGCGATSTAITLPLDQWHHVVATWDGLTMRIFIDGVLDPASVLSCPGPLVNDSPLFIGLDIPGSAEYFNGKLDDIRIYNRALNEDEIIRLYQEWYPPANMTLQNIFLQNGQSRCYNATQTITAAGSGTVFAVNSGGIATLIAGQKIILTPSTTVFHGGYLHGYITTIDQYCGTKESAVPSVLAAKEQTASTGAEPFVTIYPNPTSGNFVAEINSGLTKGSITLDVHGIRGEKILSVELSGKQKHEFSLSEKPSGVYIIRVTAGTRTETLKILKR